MPFSHPRCKASEKAKGPADLESGSREVLLEVALLLQMTDIRCFGTYTVPKRNRGSLMSRWRRGKNQAARGLCTTTLFA